MDWTSLNIADKARYVARWLYTETQSKSHGGYKIYRDTKIEVWLDTYVPNVDVYVMLDGERTRVLQRAYHGTTYVYHPGAWEGYLSGLVPLAEIAQQTHEAAIAKRAADEHAANFGPVDDSTVFGEAAA